MPPTIQRPSLPLPREVQEKKKRKLRKKRVLRTLLFLFTGSVGLALIASIVLFLAIRNQAFPKAWFEAGTISLQIQDRDGRFLHEEPAANDRFGTWLPGNQLPKNIRIATLAAEDHRLYKHPGVDLWAVFRATWSNVSSGRRISGASTLAMQLVRQLRPAKRTYRNKIKEMYWALVLQRDLQAEGILREYLNRAPYGNRVQGVQRASLLYFDRPASDLSLAQSAFLAALPWSPSILNPFRKYGRRRAWKRARRILKRARTLGMISQQQYLEALRDPLHLRKKPQRSLESIHLTEMISASWKKLPKTSLENQISTIRTTIDLRLQKAVTKILQKRLLLLTHRGAGTGAVVVFDHRKGELLAYVGSHQYFDKTKHGAIDYLRTPRAPGSTLKPFIYAQAIHTRQYTGATLLSDISASFLWKKGAYHPQNYDDRSLGPLRMRVALGNSRNIPALHALAKAGIPEVLQTLRKVGMSHLNKNAGHYGLGLALGSGEENLLQLTRAYAILARSGKSMPLRWLHQARDSLHRIVPNSRWNQHFLAKPLEQGQLLPKDATEIVAQILADPIARLPSFGRYSALEMPFPTSVKTGTSQGHRDAWTIGFSDRITVGCWVGNHDQRRMRHVSGGLGCAPIFRKVMLEAMKLIEPEKPVQPPQPPRTWKHTMVCSLSGFPATDECPGTVEEWFPPNHKHVHKTCPFHRKIRIDQRNGLLASNQCTHKDTIMRPFVLVPPAYQLWAHIMQFSQPPRRYSPACTPPKEIQESALSLQIRSPTHGSRYILDSTIPSEYSTLSLEVDVSRSVDTIVWYANGHEIGRKAWPYQMRWPLKKGQFRIFAATPDGKFRSSPILVSIR
ncbi:MAG: penicillin-binding protein 1C [Myxococcales bacterium]|nr:penicillin-binding protein 1C [Myxococcales bacterium]MCB9643066.1 penicillin-binding protein 1C [Myxococcales bacterium]